MNASQASPFLQVRDQVKLVPRSVQAPSPGGRQRLPSECPGVAAAGYTGVGTLHLGCCALCKIQVTAQHATVLPT